MKFRKFPNLPQQLWKSVPHLHHPCFSAPRMYFHLCLRFAAFVLFLKSTFLYHLAGPCLLLQII